MAILIYVLVTYVAVCWFWGLYLAVRLYTGRRLTRLMQGQTVRQRKIRPLTQNPTPPGSPGNPGNPGTPAQPVTTRAAQALAGSRAA